IPIWDNKTFYTIEALLQSKYSFLPAPIDSVMKDSVVVRDKSPKEIEFVHTVFFGFDKSSMDLEEINRLDEFIKPLIGANVRRVEIIGFSDNIGTNSYNLKLSEDRAKQIALFLLENQIIVDQIYLEGKGEIDNEEPKSRNRKVEVKIVTMEPK
ncbi:MAG: OmpA family protein, partial [Saprospiraceae bacterium]|nr:OmpA family protein [Saprospiraceae bacterium]